MNIKHIVSSIKERYDHWSTYSSPEPPETLNRPIQINLFSPKENFIFRMQWVKSYTRQGLKLITALILVIILYYLVCCLYLLINNRNGFDYEIINGLALSFAFIFCIKFKVYKQLTRHIPVHFKIRFSVLHLLFYLCFISLINLSHWFAVQLFSAAHPEMSGEIAGMTKVLSDWNLVIVVVSSTVWLLYLFLFRPASIENFTRKITIMEIYMLKDTTIALEIKDTTTMSVSGMLAKLQERNTLLERYSHAVKDLQYTDSFKVTRWPGKEEEIMELQYPKDFKEAKLVYYDVRYFQCYRRKQNTFTKPRNQ